MCLAALGVASCDRAQQAIASDACDAPVTQWLLVGPFTLDTGALRLDRSDIGNPAALYASAGDTVPGAPAMRWRAVQSDTLGRVDLYSVFREPRLDDRAAYALTYIVAPEARTVRLAVESDDDVVIWLNGRRVHRREIGRELRSGADTILLALARGSNRLLYRIVNRSGGFGLGARLLSESRDPVGDLREDVSAATRDGARKLAASDTARAPVSRPALTLGPVTILPHATLGAGDSATATKLEVGLRVCTKRWATTRAQPDVAVAGVSVPVPNSSVGQSVAVLVQADWSQLAHDVLAGGAQATLRVAGAERAHLDLALTADALLSLLSRPIEIPHWLGSRSANGALDVEVRPDMDSTARAQLARFSTKLSVPVVLAGLTLDAGIAELTPNGVIGVNGAIVHADSLGRATLCAPCVAGAPLAVSIAPHGRWWDPPRLRVREPGYREIRDGAEWARYFTGDSSIAIPDSAAAMQLLRAALDPSKSDYRAAIDSWRARLAPAASRIRRDTIDMVGHSHIDAAWLWRWREGRDAVQATWETSTKLMAKYPDMHFAASSAQYYEWMEKSDPALLARIQELARADRWNPVGGWWVESDANLPSGESLVRQALYGQRTFIRLFGKPSRVAWLPNSFGFPWSLPQILEKSGFQFFVTEEMRWNDTNRWPPTLNTFWWEGADGSRIFTDIIYAYDHDLSPARLAKEFVVTRDSSASRRMLTVYGVGDHGGGPTMAMLDRARDLERIPTFPVVRDASPDSSLARMRTDARAGPVLRDELYLEFHRGTYTTQAATKRNNRELESLLGAAEAASVISTGASLPHSLRSAWELVLFNQFHDILPGSSVGDVYRDASSDYAAADSSARRVLHESLDALSQTMDTRAPLPGYTPYIVFNPTAHTRAGLVRVPASDFTEASDAKGRALPSGIEESALVIRVPEVPAFGSRIIFLGRGKVEPSTSRRTRVLESSSLRVEIDGATGNIAHFYDKKHRRELLAPGAGSLVLIHDLPKDWDAWNIDDLNGTRASVDENVSIEPTVATPLGESIVVRRQRDRTRVTQRYVLRDAPARLDIELTLDWHEKHRLLKLAVPLVFHVDSTRAEIPYASIARPTRAMTRRDSARFETPMQRWVDASAGGAGVAIVNDSKYGYSASADTVFITLLRSPKLPDSMADMGVQRALLSIVPHAGDWRAPEIQASADEINSPLIAQEAGVHDGRATGASWLSADPASVRIGALKRAEDDDRVIVRIVETSGRATTARLHFASPVSANEVDLLERPIAGYRARGATVVVPLKPFAIKTLSVLPLTTRAACAPGTCAQDPASISPPIAPALR